MLIASDCVRRMKFAENNGLDGLTISIGCGEVVTNDGVFARRGADMAEESRGE